MKQSKMASWIESLSSTAAGFGISLLAQVFFLPMLGVTVTFSQNFAFAIIMTVISVLRGYAMRRIFEHFGIRSKLSPFAQAVLAERKRQVEVEGWAADHDDSLPSGELAAAGAAYASCVGLYSFNPAWTETRSRSPSIWPWSADWFKPAEFRRDLVKSAALILAEGEKYDRSRRRRSAEV